MEAKKIAILDSTLRDGAQAEGISFSVSDKIKIVKALDELGVTYIEAGNPGSNPKDMEFFAQAANMQLTQAKLCAFGSTCRVGTPPQEDANIRSLLDAGTPAVSVFGKTWDLHVADILKTTLEKNLEIISDTIAYLKENGKEVILTQSTSSTGIGQTARTRLRALTQRRRPVRTVSYCATRTEPPSRTRLGRLPERWQSGFTQQLESTVITTSA